MSRGKHTEEQILSAVKQMEAGRKAVEVAREIGVSTYTIYAWKAKYGGMEPSDAIRLKHLEERLSDRIYGLKFGSLRFVRAISSCGKPPQQ